MLELAYLRDNRADAIERLEKRKIDARNIVDQVIALDEKRRHTQYTLDQNLAEANRLAGEIGKLYKQGRGEEASAAKEKSAELKGYNHDLEAELKQIEKQLEEVLATIPNAPCYDVPPGGSSLDNLLVRANGEAKSQPEMLPHWELAKKYNLIDFELGVKITGAGFPVYRGKGAKLQRALIQFFLDEADKAGYEEVIPPHMVNAASGFGTGQLPDKDGQMYHVQEDELYLIPTAEVPITNMYRDVMLKEDELPVKLTGYTPCFRREAGSYGKDVRGLNRLHQFDKVEIVQIVDPAKSYEVLEQMLTHAEGLLQKLGLTYRVLKLCAGDLGFTAALTYDLEVHSSAQDMWLEVSSVSNFETYQANRLKLRIKGMDGKKRLAHTLNGSALALPRIMAALLENNQDENGINIPEVLIPYTNFKRIE